MRAAVLGHVEWVEFVPVERVPAAGEIVQAGETWAEPGGGGAVAAVQLARLADSSIFFTALGDDELGHRAHAELRALGVQVEAVFRPEPQRRGFVYVDRLGERTITVIGPKLHPRASDPLPWDEFAACDCCYYTAGDAAALRRSRSAKVLVATARELPTLREAAVELDALVASGLDAAERYRPGDLDPPPRLVVRTGGKRGGSYALADGTEGTWEAVAAPAAIADEYGAGDSFAAGLAYALGAGLPVPDALAFAARVGAEALARRGAHGH